MLCGKKVSAHKLTYHVVLTSCIWDACLLILSPQIDPLSH